MLMFTTFERARLILLCRLGLKAESETRKGFEIVLCTGASSLWAKASSPQIRQPEFNLWSPQEKEKGLWKSSLSSYRMPRHPCMVLSSRQSFFVEMKEKLKTIISCLCETWHSDVPALQDVWLLNDRAVLDTALVPVAVFEMVSCVVSIFSLC